MIHPSIIITLSLLLSYYNFPTIMVGFALVPSQIPGVKQTTSSRQRHQKQKQNDATAASTTLSQSRSDTAPDHDDETDSEAGDKVVYRPEISRREVDYDYDSSTTPSAASTSSSSHKKKKNTRTTSTNKKTIISIPRTGNLPDVHWRAISMSHLRSHPNFQPLPPPSMIHSIPTREHVRYFRQDSWQWDYLHVGRCTTSQCSAALGFLEVSTGVFWCCR